MNHLIRCAETILTSTRKLGPLCKNARFHYLRRQNTAIPERVPSFGNSRRNLYRLFFKTPSEQTFKIRDNISDAYRLIYRSNIEKYLIGCQIFTCIIGAITITILVASNEKHAVEFGSQDRVREPLKAKHSEDDFYVYVTCLLFFIIAIHVLMGRTPVRIYNNPTGRDYVFVFRGSLPFSKKFATCKATEVVKMEESGILPWKDSRYKIVKQNDEVRLILMENLFRRPADLYVMLGYQNSHFDAEKDTK